MCLCSALGVFGAFAKEAAAADAAVDVDVGADAEEVDAVREVNIDAASATIAIGSDSSSSSISTPSARRDSKRKIGGGGGTLEECWQEESPDVMASTAIRLKGMLSGTALEEHTSFRFVLDFMRCVVGGEGW